MRDDLFCFMFMGRRVCVRLDKHKAPGWSYTIDGQDEAQPPDDLSFDDRRKLEEAGMVARDRIRVLQAQPRSSQREDGQSHR